STESGAMDATPNAVPTPFATPADGPYRLALLYPGDRAARLDPAPQTGRFANVFGAASALGIRVEAAIYHDDFCDEVRRQLMQVDGVLAWVNPIEGERDRSVLDAMLREVAAAGVFVSAHPDVILKLGTKEVLHQTRDLGWGCDTHVYRDLAALRAGLPARLAGGARVLKQYRGNGGNGVWKVELAGPDGDTSDAAPVRVRHARRGSLDEVLPLGEFLQRCAAYFAGNGRLIDQAYQARLPEGMVRCYLVHGEVAGFGHQAVNALCPAADGAVPKNTERLYHPPTLLQFQSLRRRLEGEWVPAMQRLLEIDTHQLPVIWDCDFLLGPKNAAGEDSYVLCEINVSSVSPFPDSALAPMAQAVLARMREARHNR
ncbi:MAG TPA: Cj0069 family protein, partial [Burkholderiales bacterium]|nr:Cj0069 family protein [Burkholderiales bacterium]